MRKLFVLAMFAVTIIPAAFTGCTTGETASPLIPAVSSPVADIPIPAGFYMTDDSRSLVTPGSGRFVDHNYKGSDAFMPVVKFYHEQLPAKGWTLTSQIQVGEKVTLGYTKGTEELRLTIDEGTFNTKVNVLISARGSLPAPAPAK